MPKPGRRQEFKRLLEEQESITGFESQIYRKDGSLVWVSENAHLVRDEQGSLLYYEGTILDISERKQTEQALRIAEEKYHAIFENAVEGIYQTNPQGQFITANPAAARMLGFSSPEELMTDRSDMDNRFYAEPNRRQEFKRLLEEKESITGFESQIYRKDGSLVWISENAHCVRDENGNLLYYEGSGLDISERKQMELALRDSEERYRLSFENVSDVI